MKKKLEIVDFNKYFEMIPAESDELKNEVYKLRYQVYCIETGFENSTTFANEMESDEFDQQSVHYLIRHRESGIYAATTRLILPNKNNLNKLFPIEIYSSIENHEELKGIQRYYLAEASRFCVSKAFKRRKTDYQRSLTGIAPDSEWGDNTAQQEKRTYPHISIALYACAIKMSHENNIHYWYAIMEPALMRFFVTLGVNFRAIGPETDYHGRRIPCVIKISDMLKGVYEKSPMVWAMMTSGGKYG